MRHAIGVNNGNWRNGDLLQATRETIQEMNLETSVMVSFVKALMNAHWRAECADALETLKSIDPLGWERWYDMEVDDGSWQVIAIQVRKRIADLETTLDFRSALQIARDLDDVETMATRISDRPL